MSKMIPPRPSPSQGLSPLKMSAKAEEGKETVEGDVFPSYQKPLAENVATKNTLNVLSKEGKSSRRTSLRSLQTIQLLESSKVGQRHQLNLNPLMYLFKHQGETTTDPYKKLNRFLEGSVEYASDGENFSYQLGRVAHDKKNFDLVYAAYYNLKTSGDAWKGLDTNIKIKGHTNSGLIYFFDYAKIMLEDDVTYEDFERLSRLQHYEHAKETPNSRKVLSVFRKESVYHYPFVSNFLVSLIGGGSLNMILIVGMCKVPLAPSVELHIEC